MLVQLVLAVVGLVFGLLAYVSYAASQLEVKQHTFPRKYKQ